MNVILVPVDFSRDSLLALRMADYQAKTWRAGLVLLYVDTNVVSVPLIDMPLVACCPFVTHTAESRLLFLHTKGRPVAAILDAARRFEPRAIFMGHGSHDARPGPVARAVRSASPVPVEIFSETLAGFLAGAK